MKKLIYTAVSILTIASLAPTALATGRPGDSKASHLMDSAAYPLSASFRGATHQFEIHVQGRPISELSIDLPEEVSIRRGIKVTDGSGKKVDAKVSVNGRKATAVFSQPVAPDTVLSVSLQGVETPGYGNTWTYRVYTKDAGLTAEIPLGTALIRTYEN